MTMGSIEYRLNVADFPLKVQGDPASWRQLVDPLILLATVLLFSLSNYALDFLGIPYDSSSGSIVTKIHPATYTFGLALVLAVLANRNPVGYAVSLLVRCAGSTSLLAACLLLWYFISRYKPDQSASFLIDALMVAAVITMLFYDSGEKLRLYAARCLHMLMVLNCLIAITEGLTSWRLFPFLIEDRVQTWDHRATALLGHPLGGALVTGVYAVILMTVKDVRGLSPRWRLPIILLCMATIPLLGARTSFAVVYGVAAVMGLLFIVKLMRGGAISVRALLAILVLAPLGVVAVAAMYQFGYFDNFLARFTNDSGSAATRIQLFRLFDNFGLRELLIGFNQDELETSVRINGLSEGIENAWAGHLLRYGLVFSSVLWLGILSWFIEMLRVGGRGAILPLFFALLINSTSVGISAKTTMLTMPAVLILALVARTRAIPGRAIPGKV
ncbi:hypothetical protein FJ492_00370 [Mesorhizobium sp. B2-5-4]|uniref:VpsF family polysaccharide biosynthesis protein n=1 Tax=Mesorhizobium sp. B2-5-4 TaxID=2589926 RepID=UPI00112B1983|nr:VpsF family polysaccharide biosynthesis protein [Mesorhizobium sp. B2-5-4]TPK49591.1 hypothetical protein FJ492_00370 [Mesorhizobium sp. B2-5-4]